MSKPLADTATIIDNDVFAMNKYINTGNDVATPVDSGGAYFVNPYVADPYPATYWGSDYTIGETTF